MKTLQDWVMGPIATTAFAALDRTGATRTRPFAEGVAAGIRIESASRRLVSACRRRPAPPINVHVGGSGPPVLLINGWSASGLVWPSRLVERLEHRFTVYRIDNRGTGWSRGSARPYSVADLAGDVRSVIEQHDLQRPIVVGISMGGMIAQELAIRCPDLAGHLVLVSTSPPSPESTAPRSETMVSLFAASPTVDLATRIRATWLPMAGPDFVAGAPELIDEMVRSVTDRPTPYFAILDQLRAVAAWHGASRLERITAPTTIVHGAADPLIPVRNGMRLSQLIPGARYVDLPRVGHLLPYEAPDELAETIEDAAGRK
ncbi:MAG: alpha/beta fold hydrolase [Solirubrobacteraceae bacterium]